MADRNHIERQLLQKLSSGGEVNSEKFASECGAGVGHEAVVGVARSLAAAEMIVLEDVTTSGWVLTSEAETYAENGSPEVLLFNAVPVTGAPLADLKGRMGRMGDVGLKQCMQNKWLSTRKEEGVPTVFRQVESVQDTAQAVLKALLSGQEVDAKETEKLKKRKLVKLENKRTFVLRQGPKFALERKVQLIDLTQEMLAQGSWKDMEVKPYNFDSMGVPTTGGLLHPLLKVRTQMREIFLQMGFEEMPTNNFVESSFWNFDALFQPQQHPARDAHDTFFLTKPALARTFPEDYLERVKETHENGGYGSIGYGYCWKRSEAQKNLLRTHTTAVSSRMLYKLAQDGFVPKKYFSIDRVFRNEAVDKTHLAEFHQVEGVVCDRSMCLGDLIGLFEEFFGRLGMRNLKFKPAYNPYTEPSMEIFAYHEGLGKWVEVGNSGMFRPEMLRPMGLPEDVNVIAWGLSLERPTMILYGIDNIRELFGTKVDLNMVQTNPICRLGM